VRMPMRTKMVRRSKNCIRGWVTLLIAISLSIHSTGMIQSNTVDAHTIDAINS
jgi:hypothetical protein